MALYSLSVKPISRKDGRSATAAAAYRAAAEIVDDRTGLVHDYTRKRGVEHVELFAQAGITLDAPSTLWNAAEAAEKRRDGRTAREVLVALPAELDADQRTVLARQMTAELVERYGVAAQLAIHAPDRDGDQRNHHAHILITTRRYNHDGLGAKSQLEWSATQCRKNGVAKPQDELKALRERWAYMQNAALERSNISARVDHRSLSEQGIARVPQIHQGGYATDMIRAGTPENSDRALHNLSIIETNAEVQFLREELDAERAVDEWYEITPATTPHSTALELPDSVPSPTADAELALARQSARMDALERVEQHIGQRHQLQIRADLRSLERAQQRVQQRQAEAEEAEKAEKAEKARQEAVAKAQAEREAAAQEKDKSLPLRQQVIDANRAVWALDAEIKALDDTREGISMLRFGMRRALQKQINELQLKRHEAYTKWAKLDSAYESKKMVEAAQPTASDRLRKIASDIREKQTTKPETTTKVIFNAEAKALEILEMPSETERAIAFRAAASLDLDDHDALVEAMEKFLDPLSGKLTSAGHQLRAQLMSQADEPMQSADRFKIKQNYGPYNGPKGPGF